MKTIFLARSLAARAGPPLAQSADRLTANTKNKAQQGATHQSAGDDRK